MFEDGPVDGHAYLYHGVCATAVQTPIFRTFYFSFDFSQLNNPAQREELFADLMDWFEVYPTSINENELPIVQSKLQTNYIDGCQIGYNSQRTTSFYNGITVGANAVEFNIRTDRWDVAIEALDGRIVTGKQIGRASCRERV